jgi:hypothetical protein
MPTALAKTTIRVADEVWIGAALLHRENPNREDFTVDEIVQRVKREGIAPFRPGVYVHVVQHCVANRAPNPGRYRMLVETRKNRRRLFRPGDTYNPERDGSKTVPNRGDIPEKYRPLLEWYHDEYVRRGSTSSRTDPLLALRGSGRDLWADEHADEYIRRLREGWE